MRRAGAWLAALAMTAAGCVGSGEATPPAAGPSPTEALAPLETPTTAAPSPSTEPPATTTASTRPIWPVPLVVAEAERAALGPKVAIRVEATSSGWSIDLTGPSSDAPVTFDGTEQVRLTYVYDGEPTGPSWTQEMSLTDTVVRQPWRSIDRRCRPTSASNEPVVVLWQSLGDRSSYRNELTRLPEEVTVVSPIWWFVRADGTISESLDPGYVDDVHERGLAIWPAIAGLDADANHEAFADPQRRDALAHQLSDRAQALGADGINLDIEGYRVEDAAAFADFVETLVTLVHAWGGIVSYDVIPRTDEWDVTPPELSFWSVAPPRRALAAAVDCMVLMAYDQHNRFRPAGPVAAPEWVRANLQYLLRFADPQNVVLGVPFYARIWDPDQLERPRAVGVGSLPRADAVEHDPVFGLDRATLDDGRFYWVESPDVIASRLGLVDEFGLAGWAAWRLGFDSASLWEAIGARHDPAP